MSCISAAHFYLHGSFKYHFHNLFLSHFYLRAGAGKSGTFVALSQLIERLNAENVINVFKTVKRLKQDRMAVIQKLVRIIVITKFRLMKFRTPPHHPIVTTTLPSEMLGC